MLTCLLSGYCADALCKLIVGPDARTPNKRRKGKNTKQDIADPVGGWILSGEVLAGRRRRSRGRRQRHEIGDYQEIGSSSDMEWRRSKKDPPEALGLEPG